MRRPTLWESVVYLLYRVWPDSYVKARLDYCDALSAWYEIQMDEWRRLYDGR